MEIIEVTKNGRSRWEDIIVSRYEAVRRLAGGKSVIQRDHGEGKRFLFSLSSGELMEIDTENGGREILVVRTITKGNVEFVSLSDARKKAEIKKAKEWRTRSPNKLRELNCRKVTIGPLGEMRRAND